APQPGPRVYPAGRAAIVLGACGPELAGRRLAIEGRRVQAVRFGRLALLISFVDGAAYAPDELDRLRGDAPRLGAEARRLESAVERARVHGAVLPLRLLTVYAHPESLEEAAREQYARWSRGLARLRGKSECVVHLFAGPHAPPGGAPYVLRIAQKVSRTGRPPALKGDGDVLEHARRVWRECATIATATRRVATAGERGALWSAAMLLEPPAVDALAAALERSVVAGAPLGVSAYLESPRAPYCFVAER
ncbi:MAG: GvpL/GvpF family gas vesicle protein, partial [Candidatus Eremiobacteraeota bacterium]|nr:GvpL/GvpF family gas vesicle protein [Candidatus Eremiobacteraeota bacterium]